MRGLQEGQDPHYPQVVGTCKHYAAYSLEKWENYDRFMFDVQYLSITKFPRKFAHKILH